MKTPFKIKHELQRQRSKSVTTSQLSPGEEDNERRHSSPDRPDLFQDKKVAEHHDYFELAEEQAEPAASRTVSVYSPTTLSKLPYRNPIPNHPNTRPNSGPRAPPVAPSIPLISRHTPVPEPEPVTEPPTLEEMFSSSLLSSHDIPLIDEQSLSPLIVNITTPLINFTQCSNAPRDVRDADAYVEYCKNTATACIAMVGHLHSLTLALEHPALRQHLQSIRQRLYDDTKQMIQATKTARLQYPALVAQNEMVSRRNELIATIREVKVCFKTVIDLNSTQ